MDEYIKRLDNNQNPIIKKEEINNKMIFNELLLNGLRLKKGVPIKKLRLYNPHTNSIISQNLNKWKDKIEKKEGCLSITEKGIPLTDSIIADLFI